MGTTPQITDEQFQELRTMYLAGTPREQIAKRFNCSVGAIFDRNREQRLGRDGRPKGRLIHPGCRDLPRLQGRGGGRRSGHAWAALAHVSREEAEQRRDAIYRGWSAEERCRRWHAGPLIGEGRPREYEPTTESCRIGSTPARHHGWATEPRRGVVCTRHITGRGKR